MTTSQNHFVKSIKYDFKAEVIAAELVDQGLPADNVLIMMLGAAKRPYRKDVEQIIEDISSFDHKAYTIVKTHKEGLYDMLPQGLFHSPTIPKSAQSQNDILDAIKLHHIEEANARKFFLPFEASINDLRIQMALRENRLDKRLESSDMIDIFKDHWEIFEWLDERQANVFLHLLPLIHELRDNPVAAATIFELIFQCPAGVTLSPYRPEHPETQIVSGLEDTQLGINFTTGNILFNTGEDQVNIMLGPMNNITLEQFAAGGKNEKIFDLLCDYLMPVHLDLNVEYKLQDSDITTRLADEQNNYNSSLGLSTFL